MKKKIMLLLTVLLILVSLVIADSQLISYQGRIGSGGSPVDSGNITVFIYNQSIGGALVYTELFQDSISNGFYDLVLGSITDLDIQSGTNYWLDMAVNSEDINWDGNDRTEFHGFGGGLNIITSEDAGWQKENESIFLKNSSDSVGIGTNSPASKLTINSITNNTLFSLSDSFIIFGVYMGNLLGGQTGSSIGTKTDNNLYLTTNNTIRITIKNSGNIGIDTNDPKTKLEVDGIIKTTPRSAAACNNDTEGGIYYDIEDDALYGCNSLYWVRLDTRFS